MRIRFLYWGGPFYRSLFLTVFVILTVYSDPTYPCEINLIDNPDMNL
jgi:hypothetical protein